MVLFSSPVSRQIFAIQLLSYLCTQYALPKSISVARLAVSVMGTLLTGGFGCMLCLMFRNFDLCFHTSVWLTRLVIFPAIILADIVRCISKCVCACMCIYIC